MYGELNGTNSEGKLGPDPKVFFKVRKWTNIDLDEE